MGMKEIRMVGVVGTKPANVNELMNSLVVMDKTSIKFREISLMAGTSKHEARLILRSSAVQVGWQLHAIFCSRRRLAIDKR